VTPAPFAARRRGQAVRIGARHQDQQAHFEPGGRRRNALAGIGSAQIGLHGAYLTTMPATALGGVLQRVGFAGDQH
jgi:hypothetical protein